MRRSARKGRFRYEPVTQIRLGSRQDTASFYRRVVVTPPSPRLVAVGDVREFFALAGAFLAAVLTPPRAWPAYTRIVSALRYRIYRPKGFKRFRAGVLAVLGDVPDGRIEAIYREYREKLVRRRVSVARHYVPYRRKPEFRFHGLELLKDAASRPGGAIVWSTQFVDHALVGQALASAGVRSNRVSVRGHGFSGTKFGLATFNKLVAASENRHLNSRLVFDPQDGHSVTRKIAATLASGQIVLITNTSHAGSIFVEMPLGESGFVTMATTPLSFAVRRGTPLFLASLVEVEPFKTYEVHISACPPVSASGAAQKQRDHEAMARLALHARAIQLEHMAAWPGQFGAWHKMAASRLDGEQAQKA